ncbi:hypothetical protein GBF38_020755 [Nibea albiflora]|uniref:Uncharacterized protein n=1 Tax=Nibea albiflora TaxID=240163 RepID=A0ACB7FFD8_NIBAL|nr:hypothetical protein GBF38_020755 [Nibea albiflora]
MLWLSCLLIGSITCRTLDKVYGSEGPAAAPPPVPNLGLYYPGFLWSPGRVGSSSPGSSSSQPMPSSSEASQPSAPVHSSAGPANLRDEHYNPTFGGYEAPHAADGGLGGSYGGSDSGYGDSGLGGSYGGYGSSDSGLGGSYGGYGSSDSGLGGSYGGYGSSDSGLGGSYGGYGSSDSGLGGNYGSSDSGYGDSGLGGSYGGYGSSASGYVGASYGHVAPHDESSSSGAGASVENPEPIFSDVSDLEPVYSYSSRSSYQRGQEVFAQTRYTPLEPVPPFPLSRHSSKAAPQPKTPAKAPTKGGF